MCSWQKIQGYCDYKTKSNIFNTITLQICNCNTIITIFSFSWLCYPFQGHGAGAGACPSYMWAKEGSTPGWITSLSQGPMWVNVGLVCCSRVPWHYSEGVLALHPTNRILYTFQPALSLEPGILHFPYWITIAPFNLTLLELKQPGRTFFDWNIQYI